MEKEEAAIALRKIYEKNKPILQYLLWISGGCSALMLLRALVTKAVLRMTVSALCGAIGTYWYSRGRSRQKVPQPLEQHGTDTAHGVLNSLLMHIWPRISEFVETTLRETIEPVIQANVPAMLKAHFSMINLGQKSLSFRDMEIGFRERLTTTGMKKGLQVTFNLVYKGDGEVRLSLAGVPIGLSNIHLEGRVVIEMPKLIPEPPFVSGVSIYFPDRPHLSMKRCGAAEIADWDQVRGKVDEAILEQLDAQLVLPNRMPIILASGEGVFRIKCPRPDGLLRLTVVAARNLKAADASFPFGKLTSSDPYVVLRLGAIVEQTSVVRQNLNPVWEREPKEFLVYRKDEQHIVVTVMDEDKMKKHDFLGTTKILVEKLCEEQDIWLDLQDGCKEDEENSCARLGSKVRIQAEYRPLLLDEKLANLIPAASSEPTCLLFIGIYGAKRLPKIGPTGNYWCTVHVDGQEFVTAKLGLGEDEKKQDAQREVTLQKMKKLKSIGADTNAISEILDVAAADVEAELDESNTVAHVYSEGADTTQWRSLLRTGFMDVPWEEGFKLLLKDPRSAVVKLTVHTDMSPSGEPTDANPQVANEIELKVEELLGKKSNVSQESHELHVPHAPDARLDVQFELRVLGPPQEPFEY